jgi:hypothetical protein
MNRETYGCEFIKTVYDVDPDYNIKCDRDLDVISRNDYGDVLKKFIIPMKHGAKQFHSSFNITKAEHYKTGLEYYGSDLTEVFYDLLLEKCFYTFKNLLERLKKDKGGNDTEYRDYLSKYPGIPLSFLEQKDSLKQFNLTLFCQNETVPESFFINNLETFKTYSRFLFKNKSLTERFFELYLAKYGIGRYLWDFVCANPNITETFIEEHSSLGGQRGYPRSLFLNPAMSEGFLIRHIDPDENDWHAMFSNSSVKEPYIREYLNTTLRADIPDDILDNMILNPNLDDTFWNTYMEYTTLEKLQDAPSLTDRFWSAHIRNIGEIQGLCLNKNLTEEFWEATLTLREGVIEGEETKIDWTLLCLNESLPDSFFQKHIDKYNKHCWVSLCKNSSRTVDFYIRNVDNVVFDILYENLNIPLSFYRLYDPSFPNPKMLNNGNLIINDFYFGKEMVEYRSQMLPYGRAKEKSFLRKDRHSVNGGDEKGEEKEEKHEYSRDYIFKKPEYESPRSKSLRLKNKGKMPKGFVENKTDRLKLLHEPSKDSVRGLDYDEKDEKSSFAFSSKAEAKHIELQKYLISQTDRTSFFPDQTTDEKIKKFLRSYKGEYRVIGGRAVNAVLNPKNKNLTERELNIALSAPWHIVIPFKDKPFIIEGVEKDRYKITKAKLRKTPNGSLFELPKEMLLKGGFGKTIKIKGVVYANYKQGL